MKYLDLTGLQHFFDNVKSRLLPTVKGENGTVLKSTDAGYEWSKVIDDSVAGTDTAWSGSKISGDISTLTQSLSTKADQSTVDSLTTTVNSKANQSTVDSLTQTVNGKTSINDSVAETTTTWSGSKINSEIGTVQGSVDTLSGTVESLTTTVNSKADRTTVDSLTATVNGKPNINDSASSTSSVYSSSKTDSLLSDKADSSTVSSLQTTVNGKADQTALDNLSTTVNNKADSSAVTELSNTVSGLQTTVSTKADQSSVDSLSDTVSGIRQVPTGGVSGQFLRQDNTWADVPNGSWDQLITNVSLSVSGWSKDYAVTPTQFPYGNRYDISGITPHDMVIAYVDNSAGGMYTMSLCANIRVDNGFIVIGSNNNTIALTLKWIMIYKNKLPDNTNVYRAGFLVLGSDYQLARTLGAVHYIVTLPTTGWADNKITVSTDENGAGILLPAGTTYMPFSTDNYDFEISVPTLSTGTVENRTSLCKTGVYINNVTQKNLNQINVELGCVNIPTTECKVLLSINVNYQALGSAY